MTGSGVKVFTGENLQDNLNLRWEIANEGNALAAVTNQVVLGYMASILYYAANMGMAKRLWKFGLFPVCRGDGGTWPWLLGAAVFLAAGGIWLREKIRRAAVL